MSSWKASKKQYSDDQPAYDKPKEPHGEYEFNLKFANDIIKKKKIINCSEIDPEEPSKLVYCFTGTNKRSDGSYETLTAIIFSWKTRGVNFGCPISLHQNHENFRDEVGTFFDEAM